MHPVRFRKTGGKTLLGMTLVEALVAISILVIGMNGLALLFLTSWRQNGFILELGVASAAASRATDAVASDIRKTRQADDGDYPVESGDDFDVILYIDIDDDDVTERVHYFLDNRQLKRGVTEPTAPPLPTYPSGDQTVTVLANDIDNEASEPVFFYYSASAPTTPLATPVDPGQVRIVGVRIFVNLYPNRAPEDVSIESVAELRNLNYYVQ